MKQLIYVTGNKDKFQDGKIILNQYGVDVTQKRLDLNELQEMDGEKIAIHKARQAFEILNKPLFINDTIWMIPALNNFPGAFMKYMNEFFSTEQWLQLVENIKDRKIIMREILCFKDSKIEKIFYKDVEGVILKKPAGIDGVSSDKIVSFNSGKSTIAQERDKGFYTTKNNAGSTSYDVLGQWLEKHNKF